MRRSTLPARARAGNVYVNRNMIGAVVGVQPFGGEGLSGTGPKAGGPLYLHRLLAQRPDDCADTRRVASAHAEGAAAVRNEVLDELRDWMSRNSSDGKLAGAIDALIALSGTPPPQLLPGPTGERDIYWRVPRRAVLCVAYERGDLLLQLATVLAAGCLL